jgi:DNA-binding HxlR family transcriptional regulator
MTRARAPTIVHVARKEGLSQAQLARSLHVVPMTLVRLLDDLERLGWIERHRVPGDRRTRYTSISGRCVADEPVAREPVSGRNSLLAGKMQGIFANMNQIR